MITFGVSSRGTPVLLSAEQEVTIAKYLAEIIQKDSMTVLAGNICQDHVHLLLVCKKQHVARIVQKLKAVSARRFNIAYGYTVCQEKKPMRLNLPQHRGHTQRHLWTQKYANTSVQNDEHLLRTIEYIQYNRLKHGLPTNEPLQRVLETMITPLHLG
jgi:REP element-mobilizing transposase RayT